MERVLRLVLNQSDFENSVPTMKVGMFSISGDRQCYILLPVLSASQRMDFDRHQDDDHAPAVSRLLTREENSAISIQRRQDCPERKKQVLESWTDFCRT